MSKSNLIRFKEVMSKFSTRALLNFRNYHLACGNVDCVEAINDELGLKDNFDYIEDF